MQSQTLEKVSSGFSISISTKQKNFRNIFFLIFNLISVRPELVLLNNFHLDTIDSIQCFKCRIFMAQRKDLPED